MIRTVVWFGVGGFFTACYANLVRGLPMWRTPLMHVFWTSVGLGLGYRGHIFEETSEERYKELIKKHKNAPWYPKGQLLAERYAREKAEREAAMAGMEQAAACIPSSQVRIVSCNRNILTE